MKPLTEARREVLASLTPMESERVSVDQARGRVTAEDVVSSVAVPPFDNSAMDGFAVRGVDVETAGRTLSVIEDVPAGSVATLEVSDGEAIRIMTGAPMPKGADTVVKVEDTAVEGNTVEIGAATPAGTSVRPSGGDVEIGDVVVSSGVRLTSRHIASLASIGVTPLVARVPRVVVMSTGDEVFPPETTELQPGAIRDTNRPLLVSLLSDIGIDAVDLGIVGDDVDELRQAYTDAAATADLVVSTGGVSMGDYDFVKTVLGESGEMQFWKVAMQPAKPFAFGTFNDVPLLGLPGNPVSTYVAFEQFVRPALLHMMGATALLRPRVGGVMGEDISTSAEKEVFVRVLLADDDGRHVAVRSGGQQSNVLSALAEADAFAVVPVGTGSLSAGDAVTLEMFTWPEARGIDE
ncbi:MAG: molybdopterin molybdotransferase MoeA [Acidimicrobiia bacterium]